MALIPAWQIDTLYNTYHKCINEYICKLYKLVLTKKGFKIYTSKPLYVNNINHINQFKIN